MLAFYEANIIEIWRNMEGVIKYQRKRGLLPFKREGWDLLVYNLWTVG